jgi:hypothetical protein
VDPVALIVTALAKGAGRAGQDKTPVGLQSAFVRLREAVRRRLAGHPGGELALARHEADPQAGQAALAGELNRTGAGDDAGLVAAALVLIELAGGAGKYAAPVSGSQGVQVGDNNKQVNNYFIGGHAGQPGAAGPGGPGRRGGCWPR